VTLIGLSTPGAVAPSAACTTDAARATGTPLHDAYAKQQSASEKSALCGGGTLIAVVIGLLFSWIVVRTNTPFKGFIAAASILPLFAPPFGRRRRMGDFGVSKDRPDQHHVQMDRAGLARRFARLRTDDR
jgi:hypothetical protein